MQTAPIGTATASAQTGPTTQGGGMINSDFEMFLQMLTAQMTNQDPLNPVDSSDYAVQLATFSAVEQQVLTNDLLTGLSAQLAVSSMAQMAGWIGMEARAPVRGYYDGSAITVAPNPAAVADQAELVVRDANGTEVDRMEIPVAADNLEWNGLDATGQPLPSGFYSFEVVSYSGGEVLLAEPADIYQTVEEVRSEGGFNLLTLEGGQSVPAEGVSALRNPV